MPTTRPKSKPPGKPPNGRIDSAVQRLKLLVNRAHQVSAALAATDIAALRQSMSRDDIQRHSTELELLAIVLDQLAANLRAAARVRVRTAAKKEKGRGR
jgi:hypothetical protein